MANLVDSDVAALLLGEFTAAIAAIWSDMQRELSAYVMAHVDPSDRSEADVAVIADRALALTEVVKARFSVDLDAACIETERHIFDEARPH